MGKLGLLVLMAAATMATGGIEPVATDLNGVYLCEGENGSGKTYQAVVNIVEYHDTYRMRWTFPSGEPGAIGMAVRDGDSLAVMFVSGSAGVAVYRVQEDGHLLGRWTLTDADGAVFTERLTKIPGAVPTEPDTNTHGTPRKRVRPSFKAGLVG